MGISTSGTILSSAIPHIHRDQSNLQYRGELLDDYVYSADRELINPSRLSRGVDIGSSARIVIPDASPPLPRRPRR
jgi:hypothetical protein